MNLYDLPVHPLVSAISMSPQANIKKLSLSMQCHGQQVTVKIAKIKGVMMLVDGRHRLAAAKLIGLELKYEEIKCTEKSIVNFISDMTFSAYKPNTSQEAMWLAQANLKGCQGLRNDLTSRPETVNFISPSSMQRARYILKYSKHIANEVLAGKMALKPAYDAAKAEMATRDALIEKTEILQNEAPEFYDRVVSGEDIEGVFVEFKHKKESECKERLAIIRKYKQGINGFFNFKCKNSRQELIDAINSDDCSKETTKKFKQSIETVIKNANKLLEEIAVNPL